MNARRVLVVGSNGLLGQKISDLMSRGGNWNVIHASLAREPARKIPGQEYHRLDITVKKDVKHLVHSVEPDIVINAAALTNVDQCENDREVAWKINVDGVSNLVDAVRRSRARIVHVSTDYVFDGKSGPYSETDRPDPLNYYGRSKLASENVLLSSGLEFLIFRTMVLYGYAPGVKTNFALWLIQNLERRSEVRIVDDQFGNPTLVDDLAYAIARGVELNRHGLYHVAGRDIVSRFQFASTLAKVFGYDGSLITPIKTAELKQPAVRPLKSGLVTLKAEVELGYSPSTMEQGLNVLKNQMHMNTRRVPDSGPVPRGQASRQARHKE